MRKWLPLHFVLLSASFVLNSFSYIEEVNVPFTAVASILYFTYLIMIFLAWWRGNKNEEKKITGIKTLYVYCFLPLVNYFIVSIFAFNNIRYLSQSKRRAWLLAVLPLLAVFAIHLTINMTVIFPFTETLGGLWRGVVWIGIGYTFTLLLSVLLVLVHKIFLRKEMTKKFSLDVGSIHK